jgi:hypothetical protein
MVSQRGIRARSLALWFIALALLSGAALGQGYNNRDFPDVTDEPWVEVAAQLPPIPKPENLIVVNIGSSTNFTTAVDTASLSISPDGVVHYTLVKTSPGGARNVSFEGLRCATREIKRYAFGQPDGTWASSQNASWQRASDNDGNHQAALLAKDMLCRDHEPFNSVADLVRHLKQESIHVPR